MRRTAFSAHLRLLLLALSLALPLVACPLAAACNGGAGRTAVEAWAGEWQLVVNGHPAGRSSVRPILGGCAFEEVRHQFDGSETVGLTYLDPATGAWEQHRVSSLGHTARFALGFEPDAVTLIGTINSREAGRVLARATLQSLAGGGFRETLELSDDNGASYRSPVVTDYLPQVSAALPGPEVEPAPPTSAVAPEPRPSAADPSLEPEATESAPAALPGITERSQRKTHAPLPATTPMQSPMTLEFQLGPLADLPPGGSWRTTELAPYVVERVSIPMVTAAHRVRRGKDSVELTVNLLTQASRGKVDLAADLLSDGVSVGRVEDQKVALGSLITSHDQKTGRPVTLRLELAAQTFAEIFAGGKRPSVRLTVAVR